MASIELNHISKVYGNGFEAVKDFHLSIDDGEFLVLLGPSGCGKTTTMRMIAGLEDVTAGQLSFNGEVVNDYLPRDRNVAMVFQNYGLYPHMTVRQNIEYPLKMRKVPIPEREPRIQKAAKRVELESLLDRKPKALSGGQRQRVALARALVRREPNVFLMDEPLSNLDAKLRVVMRAELKHLHHELGVTTVYVTHDQLEAMTLADRVVIMNKGEVMQVGTPEQIYSDPANIFVAGFIGSPAMNLIHGSVKDNFFVSEGVRVPVELGADRENIVLGIRCEDLTICETNESAHINGSLFSLELLGETTQTTLMLPNKERVVLKTPKGYRETLDANLGAKVNLQLTYLFDGDSGERLDI